jgi:proteasome lid subunit RPN8/RPN11
MSIESWEREIRAHAGENPGEEVCGFIVRDGGSERIIRAENIAPDRSIAAAPHPDSVRQAHEAEEILFAYHTHAEKDSPSDSDSEFCDAFGVPYLVVTPNRVVVLHPTPTWGGLIGTRWSESTDCLWMCIEFSGRVHGLRPDWVPGPEEWSKYVGKGAEDHDVYFERHEMAGLALVDSMALRFGDWISFRVPSVGNRSPRENHIGVYIGDGKMLHLPREGVASEEELDRYLPYIAHVYRFRILAEKG